MNTLLCLRLLFACLVAGCLMQIGRELALPACTPVFIVTDSNGSSYLRQHDPDVPRTQNEQVQRELPTNEVPEKTEEPPKRMPKMTIAPLYKAEQERIDTGMGDAARCAQYGVQVLPEDQRNTKRIFFGSMLANENPEVLAAHAIEVYNKYDVIALVESNTTHSGHARKMSYGPNSMNARILKESEMFGSQNKTKVIIDYWLEDLPELDGMNREVEQRNTIWKIWLKQGMTQRDIGIMSDLDEIVSRDFLNALQVCDFPKTRYNPDQRPDCQTPKMPLSAIQFDGSPLCVKNHQWYHPDVILGNCILGIGDPTGRAIPEREVSPPGSNAKTLGERGLHWGLWDYNRYPQDIIDNKRFPLWDGRDIRGTSGSADDLMNFVKQHRKGMGKTAHYGTAYHLHNWFNGIATLRHKFSTYGHAEEERMTMPLSNFTGDVNMMIRCVHRLGNEIKVFEKDDPNEKPYYDRNRLMPEGSEQMFSLGGNRPIYFKNWTYVLERHEKLVQMVLDDEAVYGSIYNHSNL